MAFEWLTYAEAGKRLGISAEAVRQKAIRGQWQRRPANDGKTQVRVDVDEVLAASPPREARSEQPSDDSPTPEQPPVDHVADTRTLDALNAHIATLKDMVAKAEHIADLERGRTETERLRADAERARADELAARLERMRSEGEGRSAALEQDLAELRKLVETMREPRPWWRRLTG